MVALPLGKSSRGDCPFGVSELAPATHQAYSASQRLSLLRLGIKLEPFLLVVLFVTAKQRSANALEARPSKERDHEMILSNIAQEKASPGQCGGCHLRLRLVICRLYHMRQQLAFWHANLPKWLRSCVCALGPKNVDGFVVWTTRWTQ